MDVDLLDSILRGYYPILILIMIVMNKGMIAIYKAMKLILKSSFKIEYN